MKQPPAVAAGHLLCEATNLLSFWAWAVDGGLGILLKEVRRPEKGL
jgi:hypothetical protein